MPTKAASSRPPGSCRCWPRRARCRPMMPGWAYEMKWDGLRALAFIAGGQVRLTSRTARDVTFVYPELAGLATAVWADQAVLDGEIVAFGSGSWPDFEALQQRMNISTSAQAKVLAGQVPVGYLAFDLLWLSGRPLLDEPYTRRRELLDNLGLDGGRWQVPPAFIGESGADIQAVSRQQHLEGVMAKRLGSRYEPGRRMTAAADQERASPGGRDRLAGSWARAAGPAGSARSWSACTMTTAHCSTAGTSAPGSRSRRCGCWEIGWRRCAGIPRRSRARFRRGFPLRAVGRA